MRHMLHVVSSSLDGSSSSSSSASAGPVSADAIFNCDASELASIPSVTTTTSSFSSLSSAGPVAVSQVVVLLAIDDDMEAAAASDVTAANDINAVDLLVLPYDVLDDWKLAPPSCVDDDIADADDDALAKALPPNESC